MARIDRAEDGNFDDCEPIGEGVSEMQFHKALPRFLCASALLGMSPAALRQILRASSIRPAAFSAMPKLLGHAGIVWVDSAV